MLKLGNLVVKSSKKGVHIQCSFVTRNFFMKMLTEDEVRLQSGVSRYLDIKVKEIKTYKHF